MKEKRFFGRRPGQKKVDKPKPKGVDFLAYTVLDLDSETAEKQSDVFLLLQEDCLRVLKNGKITETFPLADFTDITLHKGVGASSVLLENGEDCRLLGITSGTYTEDLANFVVAVRARKRGQTDRKEKRVGFEHVSGKRCLLRLFLFAKPQYPLLFTTLLLYFVSTGISLLIPILNRNMVDEYINRTDIELSAVLVHGFLLAVLAYFGSMILQRLVLILRGGLMAEVSSQLVYRLRGMMFKKTQSLSLSRISQLSTGELLMRVNHDTSVVRNFIVSHLPTLLESVIMLVAFSAYMLLYDWRMALLILLPTPLVALIFRSADVFIKQIHRREREVTGRERATLHDTFSGVRVVKAYGTEKTEEEKFCRMADNVRKSQLKTSLFYAWLMPLVGFLIGFGEYVLLYYVGNRMLDGTMTAGEMSQFSAYSSMIFSPLINLSKIPKQFASFMTCLYRIYEIADEPETLPEGQSKAKLQGRIDLNHVTFSYNSGDEILQDVDLHIEPGEFIGIVGKSGAGKSTLINLIMRMYDVDDGSITVDGTDIRNFSKQALRSQMGVVLQENYLFTGTVLDNITYAKPDASREDVITACKNAGAHEFIMCLPDGYDTYIGEKGYTLSGGERQRIAIARALLHNPKILILDEATASLDTETEKLVQDALLRLSSGRTTVAIAHRLSTLRNATRLVVLDKRKIAECGTHDELMEQKGIYYNLVMAQKEINRMQSEKDADERIESNQERKEGKEEDGYETEGSIPALV